VRSIKFVCLVAAPEWVEKVTSIFPDVPIVAAAIDRCLDEAGYFLPMIGDAGDRLFGTKIAHSRYQAASSSSRTTAGPSILRGLVWTQRSCIDLFGDQVELIGLCYSVGPADPRPVIGEPVCRLTMRFLMKPVEVS
jgi:hypothetical protein